MSEYLDSPENGFGTTNGQTCISSETWDTIIKWVIISMVSEIIIFTVFMGLRSKRHSADQEAGMALVRKSKLSWKLAKKKMKRRRRKRKA
ncbi:hypothetical protein I204_04706 [Kwoniella mangroviensis CBS 8886]|nr:hypothetical protein I204_04706 [Kwoniella mangroviensis CBS 8886]